MNKSNSLLIKRKYDYNGWVLVKNIFSSKQVKKINQEIDIFLKKKIKKYKGRNINFINEEERKKSINNINSFHKLSDSLFIKKQAKNKKILNIAKLLIDSKPKFIASELFAKPAIKGLPSPMHQDNFYWCIKDGNALTVWLAVDQVSSKNGAIQYYSRTHKLGTLKHIPSFAKGSSQTIANLKKLKKFKKFCPKLNPGDALFHHSEIVHGSSANKSGKRRRALTLQFKDFKAKYDDKLKKKYLSSLKKQIKQKKEKK